LSVQYLHGNDELLITPGGKTYLPEQHLWAYATVTSTEMAFPIATAQPGQHSRIFKMNSNTDSCSVVLDLKSQIAPDTLLHLTLLGQMNDSKELHKTYSEMAKVQTLLLPILKGQRQTVSLTDVHDSSRSVGHLLIQLDPLTARGRSLSSHEEEYKLPHIAPNNKFNRTPAKEWKRIMNEYIDSQYSEVWSKRQSSVTFPLSTVVYKGSPFNESVASGFGTRIPYIMYQALVSRVDVPDPTGISEVLIRLGCLYSKIDPDQLPSLSQPELLHVLCHAITSLPRILGYSYYGRGSEFNEPMASNSISTASMVCVELAGLCGMLVRAIRQGKSERCRLFHSLLNDVYALCQLSCTNRSGKNSSRHVVACLIPRSLLFSTATKETWKPQLLETMAEVDFNGDDDDKEDTFSVKGILPSRMTHKEAFEGKSAHYGSAIKLYWVEETKSGAHEFTFIDSKRNSVGIPMHWLFNSKEEESEGGRYKLISPVPVTESMQVLFEEAHTETKELSSLWLDQMNVTDQWVQSFLLDEKNNTRISLYCVDNQQQSINRLDSLIKKSVEISASNVTAQRHPQLIQLFSGVYASVVTTTLSR
jgi:hypothetical protein